MSSLLKSLNRHVPQLKILLWFLGMLPSVVMLYRYQTDQLGINGLEYLIRNNGFYAMLFLILTLAITPTRRLLAYVMKLIRFNYGKRLGDWNWMIRIRRLLGLFSFYYATLHFLVYFYFEQDLIWQDLWLDIEERPFILAGISAFVLLIPLAITSTDGMMRRLKKNWRRLHRLIYPISLIVIIHYWWLTKPGVYDVYPYALLVVLLLLFRLLAHYHWLFKRDDDGMEAKR